MKGMSSRTLTGGRLWNTLEEMGVAIVVGRKGGVLVVPLAVSEEVALKMALASHLVYSLMLHQIAFLKGAQYGITHEAVGWIRKDEI